MSNKITLIYETTVAVTVDLDEGEVEEVTVLGDLDEPILNETRTQLRNSDSDAMNQAIDIAEAARESNDWPAMEVQL